MSGVSLFFISRLQKLKPSAERKTGVGIGLVLVVFGMVLVVLGAYLYSILGEYPSVPAPYNLSVIMGVLWMAVGLICTWVSKKGLRGLGVGLGVFSGITGVVSIVLAYYFYLTTESLSGVEACYTNYNILAYTGICSIIIFIICAAGITHRLRGQMGRVLPGEKASYNIINRLNGFVKECPNLFVDDIKDCLSKNDIVGAERLLKEKKRLYERFLELRKIMRDVDDKTTKLSSRLAEGELSPDTYELAMDELKRKKHDIDEDMWEIQRKIFREKYEKPF
ncbi:MAG: hypothetical protein L6265_11960 [Thermoplasmatales archaeon]|nr:hypothetical protein [Thermoplasmatales archaeon]